MTPTGTLSPLEAAILGTLSLAEGYGLSIHEELVRRGVVDADAAPARYLYPVLRAMESRGWLTSRDGEPLPERGNRPRRYYTLTQEGRAARAAPALRRKP